MQERDPLQFMLEKMGENAAKIAEIPMRPKRYVVEFPIEDMNDAALHARNAVSANIYDSAEPIESLLELGGEPDYVRKEFAKVRDVLTEMPDEVLAFLCKQRGWNVGR